MLRRRRTDRMEEERDGAAAVAAVAVEQPILLARPAAPAPFELPAFVGPAAAASQVQTSAHTFPPAPPSSPERPGVAPNLFGPPVFAPMAAGAFGVGDLAAELNGMRDPVAVLDERSRELREEEKSARNNNIAESANPRVKRALFKLDA